MPIFVPKISMIKIDVISIISKMESQERKVGFREVRTGVSRGQEGRNQKGTFQWVSFGYPLFIIAPSTPPMV